ncbi:hypothetical protein LWI29_005676 [Acer saccharum]|uniref:Uncharacterized protein n=1 Tax=Acer saccharum TaxID=4024 RepID=A0AA39TIQ4_ACESA|nr:hypothetical protein LWI29_005676 [Acer saccharum]
MRQTPFLSSAGDITSVIRRIRWSDCHPSLPAAIGSTRRVAYPNCLMDVDVLYQFAKKNKRLLLWKLEYRSFY